MAETKTRGPTEQLAERIRRGSRSGPRSTDSDDCGDFGLRIGSDGRWYHYGTEITRLALVKLFSTVLRREDDGTYWLVTPVERGRIAVDDVPFVVVEVTVSGSGPEQRLTVRTNLDEEVVIGSDHPLSMREADDSGELRPYIPIRPGLEAKVLRPVYYHLVELAESRAANQAGELEVGVWSDGMFFSLGQVLSEDA
ncbi:MAG: DUF1285 domain-containing protein [Alphaproteobacteria bacterium]|nr:DUF1285 domain-containing protein [Alphaproteobacteria bacterium]